MRCRESGCAIKNSARIGWKRTYTTTLQAMHCGGNRAWRQESSCANGIVDGIVLTCNPKIPANRAGSSLYQGDSMTTHTPKDGPYHIGAFERIEGRVESSGVQFKDGYKPKYVKVHVENRTKLRKREREYRA